MSEIVCYIPSFNDSELVRESLASSPDWNVVISDNASDEPHLSALAGDRVQVIRHAKNLGRVGNWKFCVGHFIESGATWMKFLLAGDVHTPDALGIFRRAISQYPDARIVLTRVVNVMPQGRHVWEPTPEAVLLSPVVMMRGVALRGNVFHGLISALFHVDAVRDGFEFGEGVLSYCADLQFLMSIARRTACLYVPEIGAEFIAAHRKHFRVAHASLEHALEEGLLRFRAAQNVGELSGKPEAKAELEKQVEDWVGRAVADVAQRNAAARADPQNLP